jgi:hypothetical protein
MAGSLSHICGEDGFTMDLIENLEDAHEALEECYNIIARLAERRYADGVGDGTINMSRINSICDELHYPHPRCSLILEK